MGSDFTALMKGTKMFGEIQQIPESVLKTAINVEADCLKASKILSKSRLVYIIGSGTSYHAGIILQIELLKRGIPAIIVKAPEFSYFLPENKDEKTTAVLISQSGESRDILHSLKEALERGYSTIALTNTKNSSLSSSSEISIVTAAGREEAVAATKTFVAALEAINIIIEKIDDEDVFVDFGLEKELNNFLKNETDRIIEIANTVKNKVVFLGNGYLHAVALEGALKFKETSTIETEAYPIREYLHGPIQTLTHETTVFVLYTSEIEIKGIIDVLQKQTSSIIKIGFFEGDEIKVKRVSVPYIPAMFVLPIQIMASYKSVKLGHNPDHPEHLNKVVK